MRQVSTYSAFTCACLAAVFFMYVDVTALSNEVVTIELDHKFGKISQVVQKVEGQAETILFVGDVLLARDVEKQINQNGILFPYQQIPQLAASDSVVGNFEAAVPPVHEPTPKLSTVFSVTPLQLDGLVQGGFSHLSLANNHSFDFGEIGFTNTVAELQKRNFSYAGHPNDVGTSSVVYIESAFGVISILMLNVVGNEWSLSDAKILQEIDTASDIQIVYIHWGEEYELRHSRRQKEIAKDLIEFGADAIIGHHPHVLQDIEIYHDTIIFYSLGNFIFDQYFNRDVQEGLVLQLGETAEGIGFTLLPIYSEDESVEPLLMNTEEKEMLLETLAERSSRTLREEINAGFIKLR